MEEDKEMHDFKGHAALDKAFEETTEEYHQHSLEKPNFDSFRLQFEGPHSQVADKIPTTSEETLAESGQTKYS